MSMSLQLKYVTTFALFFCYFAYGVNFYVVGPTLIELADLFETTIEKICFIYTLRAGGYTIGSFGGFLFRWVNRQLALVFFLTVMGLSLIVMPHCTSTSQLFTFSAINGISIGAFDTAINVWILEMWGKESSPFMQALHFTYALGSFVAPLICEPFLAAVDSGALHGHGFFSSDGNDTDYDSQPLNLFNLTGNGTHRIFEEETEEEAAFVVFIPYAIGGILTILAAAWIAGLYYYKKYEPPSKNLTVADDKEELERQQHQRKRESSKAMVIWMVSLGSLFLTFFVGMEQTHLQFLPTFAVNSDLKLTPSRAALIASAAAAAFTVGRGVSIPLAIKLAPQVLLYVTHFLMLLGTVILIIYAHTSEMAMWVGNMLIGAGFSSVYASIYAFLEHHICVTNNIGSVFVFAGGLTSSLAPTLVGHYIEARPLILMYFNLVSVALCFFLLLVIHFSVYYYKKRNVDKSIEETPDSQKKLVPAADEDKVVLNGQRDKFLPVNGIQLITAEDCKQQLV